MNVLIHVPHSSARIPADVRADLTVDDETLTREIATMTDWLTAPLALAAIQSQPEPPSLWINPWSRLVIDPERFPDDREEMAKVGMGAVYSRLHDGDVLRRPDPARDERLLARYFHPYAAGLADAAAGETVIIDVHSYPTRALSYELAAHGDRPRPPLCIGTDPFHTPGWLIDTVRESWQRNVGGEVGVDQPFAGTYVPLDRYRTDPRLRSVMVEIRRDQLHPDFDDPDRLLAGNLLPERPWETVQPGDELAQPAADTVAFLAAVVEAILSRPT